MRANTSPRKRHHPVRIQNLLDLKNALLLSHSFEGWYCSCYPWSRKQQTKKIQRRGRRTNDFSILLPKDYLKARLPFSSSFLNTKCWRSLQIWVRRDRRMLAGEKQEEKSLSKQKLLLCWDVAVGSAVSFAVEVGHPPTTWLSWDTCQRMSTPCNGIPQRPVICLFPLHSMQLLDAFWFWMGDAMGVFSARLWRKASCLQFPLHEVKGIKTNSGPSLALCLWKT